MAPIHHKPNLHDMLLEWSKHSEIKEKSLILLNIVPDERLEAVVATTSTCLENRTVKGKKQDRTELVRIGQELHQLINGVALEEGAINDTHKEREIAPNPEIRIYLDEKETNQKHTCLYFQLYYFLEVVTKNIAMIDITLLTQSKKGLVKQPAGSQIVKNYDENYQDAQSNQYRYWESYKFTELLRKNQRAYEPETVMYLYDFLSCPETLELHNFPHLVKMFYEDLFRYQTYHLDGIQAFRMATVKYQMESDSSHSILGPLFAKYRSHNVIKAIFKGKGSADCPRRLMQKLGISDQKVPLFVLSQNDLEQIICQILSFLAMHLHTLGKISEHRDTNMLDTTKFTKPQKLAIPISSWKVVLPCIQYY
jgi:hypothetical protein